MGFTVARQGGTKDIDFEAYSRLLRQKGVDLAKLQRTPEPGTGRRWLYVWSSKADAQAFAEELTRRTKDPGWQVVEVNGQASEGPLGPVEIQVARQNDGWAFALHPLSRRMVQRVFPGSCRQVSIFIRTDTAADFQATPGDVADLAAQAAMILTGLSLEKITATFGGYRVYDPVAKKEVMPSAPVQA